MVKIGREPASRGMAAIAKGSQFAFMDIILRMAGITLLGGGFHIRYRPRAGMASGAGDLAVFPIQLKSQQAVVESMAV